MNDMIVKNFEDFKKQLDELESKYILDKASLEKALRDKVEYLTTELAEEFDLHSFHFSRSDANYHFYFDSKNPDFKEDFDKFKMILKRIIRRLKSEDLNSYIRIDYSAFNSDYEHNFDAFDYQSIYGEDSLDRLQTGYESIILRIKFSIH